MRAYSSRALRTMVRTSALSSGCDEPFGICSSILSLPERLSPFEACVDLHSDSVLHLLADIAQIFVGQAFHYLALQSKRFDSERQQSLCILQIRAEVSNVKVVQ